jgi:hypothetical protein
MDSIRDKAKWLVEQYKFCTVLCALKGPGKLKRLVIPVPKGGVSLTTLRPPKGPLHSLPLTLSIETETTVPVLTLGARLTAAASFPTLFSTASGVSGLVAGPSKVLRRWISSEAFQLASAGGCATGPQTRSRHICNFCFRVLTVWHWSATACDGAFAKATGLASSLSGCLSFTDQRQKLERFIVDARSYDS